MAKKKTGMLAGRRGFSLCDVRILTQQA